MPFYIDPSIRRAPSLERLFDNLGLPDSDASHCIQLLKADPNIDLRFGYYLLRLYASSNSNERAHLLGEDFDKIKACLWCIRELEAFQISIKLNADASHEKIPKKLPDLYSQIKSHLSLFKDRDLPAFVEGVLGSDIARYRSGPAIGPENQTESEILETGSARILYQEDSIKLVQLYDVVGARWYGQNTVWCTSYLHTDKHFVHYMKQGGLFVLILNEKDKFQFHFQGGALNDSTDKEVTFEDICSKPPIVDGEPALRSRIVHALAKAALGDGRRKNYYPFQDVWGSRLPEDLQEEAVQLAVDLVNHAEWRYIEDSFLSEIGKLSPVCQSRAMEVVKVYATHSDAFIRTFAIRYLAEQYDQLTPENQVITEDIFVKLAEDPDATIQESLRFSKIPSRHAPAFAVQAGKTDCQLWIN